MVPHASACRALLVELSEATHALTAQIAGCDVTAAAAAGDARERALSGRWDVVALPLHLAQNGVFETFLLASDHWVLVLPSGARDGVWVPHPGRSPAFVVDEDGLPAALGMVAKWVAARHATSTRRSALTTQRTELELGLARVREQHEKLTRQAPTVLARILEVMEHRSTLWASRRAALYSVAIGHQLGLSRAELEELRLGALLHDVGMAAMSDRLADGTEPRTLDEQLLLQAHPLYGAQLLEGLARYRGVQDIIAQHHECFDGSGEPLGLAGEMICLGARVVAVGARLEARTGPTASQLVDEAGQSVQREVGARFDPLVVEAFEALPRATWKTLVAFGRAQQENIALLPMVTDHLRGSALVRSVTDGDLDAFWAWICSPNEVVALPT